MLTVPLLQDARSNRSFDSGLPDSSRLQVVTGRGISIHRSGIII